MSDDVVITNCSRQLIPIQVRRPKGDFFYEERQVRLSPGATVTLPKSHLYWAQIENCRARGELSVTG